MYFSIYFVSDRLAMCSGLNWNVVMTLPLILNSLFNIAESFGSYVMYISAGFSISGFLKVAANFFNFKSASFSLCFSLLKEKERISRISPETIKGIWLLQQFMVLTCLLSAKPGVQPLLSLYNMITSYPFSVMAFAVSIITFSVPPLDR